MNFRPFRRPTSATVAWLAGLVLVVSAAIPTGQAPAPGRGGQPGQVGGARGGRGATPPRDATTTSVVGTGAISGMVMLEGAGVPVRRARVTLTGVELRGGRSAITDDQGRFSFQALPAGRFTMTAAKAGFVDMTYGAKRPGRPGTPIQLEEGQKLDKTVITMPRGSVITGIVVDENGEPAPGTQVRALRYVMRTGERSLQQTGQDQTDDRGYYRIYQLQPGEYVVSAVPRNLNLGDLRDSIATEVTSLMQQAQAMGVGGGGGGFRAGGGPGLGGLAALTSGPGAQQLMARAAELQQQLAVTEQEQGTAYAPVYFPGTTSPSSATTVTLGTGEERAGVDFQLQLVSTAKLDGIVANPDGTVPANTNVVLVASDRAGSISIPGLGSNSTRTNAAGQFSLRNVAPGQYSLQARANVFKTTDPNAAPAPAGPGRGGRGPGAPGQISQVLWAAVDVTVGGQNQSGLSLTLQPGMTVSGRVEFRGSNAQPPADLTRVRVSLTSRGPQLFEMGGVPPGEVDSSGRFTIAGVPPGRYVFSASAPGTGGGAVGQRGGGRGLPVGGGTSSDGQWVLTSALVNGRDALDFPVDIGPNADINNATLTFTDRVQELTGTIQDANGRPTSDFTIIVFPADRQYWQPQARRIASARPGTDGTFSMRTLPAGEYRLTAVTDVEPGEWYDPAFLTQLLPASIAVSLRDGEKKVQDIRLAGGA